MAGEEQGPTEEPGLAILRHLVEATAERPEHRVLDRLVGEWTTRAQWQVASGGAWIHRSGRATNAWILDGRVIESCTFDEDGLETTRCYLAFDPSVDDYVAFGMSIWSLTYQLDRGSFDDLGPALVFEGHEVLPNRPAPLRYHRTYTFLGDDEFTIGITYPDHPPGAFGGMFIEHHRTGS